MSGWTAEEWAFPGGPPRLVGAPAGAAQQKRTPTSTLSRLRRALAGGAPGFWASDHLEEARHYTGWPFCTVTFLARQAAQCQVAVTLPRLAERGRKARELPGAQGPPCAPDNHPLSRLMKRANPEQSGAEFRFALMQQLGLTGSALVWVVKDELRVPRELYCVPTALAIPQGPTTEYPDGSWRVQPVGAWASPTDPDGWLPTGTLGQLLVAGGVLDGRVVKPIRWPHPLHLSDGLSPLTAGALWVDEAEQLARSRHSVLRQAIQAGLIMEQIDDLDLPEDDWEAFRQELRDRQAGSQNAGRDLILPKGLKATPRTVQELDYEYSWPQTRDNVLALYGTPPIALGISEAGSYAAYYASLLQATDIAVQPHLDLIAGELTEAVAYERWQGAQIHLKARKINDPSIEETQLKNDVAAGAITYNEYRSRRGLAPVSWGEARVGTEPQAASAQQPASALEDDGATPTSTGVRDPARQGLPRQPSQKTGHHGTHGTHGRKNTRKEDRDKVFTPKGLDTKAQGSYPGVDKVFTPKGLDTKAQGSLPWCTKYPGVPQERLRKGSFFGECERDEEGHCLPGEGAASGGREASESEPASSEHEQAQQEHAAYQERVADRERRRDVLFDVENGDHTVGSELDEQFSDVNSETSVGQQMEPADRAAHLEKATAHLDSLPGALLAGAERLAAVAESVGGSGAGIRAAAEKARPALEKPTERAREALGAYHQALAAWDEARTRSEEADGAVTDHEESPPEEPDLPDEPDDDSPDSEWAAWRAEVARLEGEHRQALADWQARGRELERAAREADRGADRAERAADKAADVFDSAWDKVGAAYEKAGAVVTGALYRMGEKLSAALEAEEEADEEPDQPGPADHKGKSVEPRNTRKKEKTRKEDQGLQPEGVVYQSPGLIPRCTKAYLGNGLRS